MRGQEPLDEFPDGASAAAAFADVVYFRQDLGGGIAGAGGAAAVADTVQVIDIVANIGDLIRGQAQFFGEPAQLGKLVIDALVYMGDAHFRRALGDDMGASPGKNGRRDPGFGKQAADAGAILAMKGFHHFPVGAHVDAPVCQGAVHIHNKQLNIHYEASFLLEIRIYIYYIRQNLDSKGEVAGGCGFGLFVL